MAQALAAKLTGKTDRFGTFELDRLKVFYRDITAAGVQPYFGWTDTMTEVFPK